MDTYNHKQLFQSTLPQGERRKAGSPHGIYTGYFNPRSHKGSDMLQDMQHGVMYRISIHAPTRGATPTSEKRRSRRNFNPRSHKGSDSLSHASYSSYRYFNPRSHKGSDAPALQATYRPAYFNPRSHKGSDIIGGTRMDVKAISIHAPTRGATDNGSDNGGNNGDFNPRSHKGSDSITTRKKGCL